MDNYLRRAKKAIDDVANASLDKFHRMGLLKLLQEHIDLKKQQVENGTNTATR